MRAALKLGPNFLFRAFCFGRVREVVVQAGCLALDVRATLVGVVANRNDVIHRDVQVFLHVVAAVVCNVNAIFHHGGYGAGIEAMRFYACAVHLCARAQKMFEVSVGHLASAAVAGTEYDMFFIKPVFVVIC